MRASLRIFQVIWSFCTCHLLVPSFIHSFLLSFFCSSWALLSLLSSACPLPFFYISLCICSFSFFLIPLNAWPTPFSVQMPVSGEKEFLHRFLGGKSTHGILAWKKQEWEYDFSFHMSPDLWNNSARACFYRDFEESIGVEAAELIILPMFWISFSLKRNSEILSKNDVSVSVGCLLFHAQ